MMVMVHDVVRLRGGRFGWSDRLCRRQVISRSRHWMLARHFIHLGLGHFSLRRRGSGKGKDRSSHQKFLHVVSSDILVFTTRRPYAFAGFWLDTKRLRVCEACSAVERISLCV
jgi:hypothetical protein